MIYVLDNEVDQCISVRVHSYDFSSYSPIRQRFRITSPTVSIQYTFFHIVIFLSLEARYLARFRVTSHTCGYRRLTLLNHMAFGNNLIRYLQLYVDFRLFCSFVQKLKCFN